MKFCPSAVFLKVKFDMGEQMRLNRKCDRKVLAVQEAKYWPSTGAGNLTAGQISPIFQIMQKPTTDIHENTATTNECIFKSVCVCNKYINPIWCGSLETWCWGGGIK